MRPEPERSYLSVRARKESFADAVALLLQLLREVPRQLPRGMLGTVIGVTHSPEFEPDDLDIELGFALNRAPARLPQLSDGTTLGLRTLPAHPQVATCVRVGSPEKAHLTTGRIGRWLEDSNYRLAGPNREIFLQLPQAERIGDAVIEMAFPVEPA
jgi:hypothetical protein